jgi:hypothetical protein
MSNNGFPDKKTVKPTLGSGKQLSGPPEYKALQQPQLTKGKAKDTQEKAAE